MQIDMAFFQQLLATWMQLALDNTAFVVCLAIAVWLLTTMLYSLRISALKSHVTTTEKARQDAQTQIESQQQSIQQLEHHIEADKAQIEQAHAETATETQRATALEARLIERNSQFAATLQAMARALDLPEPDLPPGDALWHQREQWLDKFAGCHAEARQAKAHAEQNLLAETAKLTEKDLVIAALQVRLDSQSEQLARLERAAAERADIEGQLTDAQRQLSELRLKQDNNRIAVAASTTNTQAQPTNTTPAADSMAASAPPPVPAAIVEPAVVKSAPAPVVAQMPAPAANKPDSEGKASAGMGGKLKGWFGHAVAQMEKIDELLATKSGPMIEAESKAPIRPQRIEPPKPEPVAPAPTSAVAETAPTRKSSLFSFGKNKPATVQARVAPPPVEQSTAAANDEPAGNNSQKTSKLTGLLGRFKKT
ncbi:MAG: hypothetical protein KGZ80_00615 [Methylomonas sp.]|nr:hypothetical protein [Methylomonas sp.]PPD21125.1 MAG: hypothetical protein CTY23_06450 [Methylomonas sp.]PPD27559.1 MAG: hypothetical protein CTY22_01480 [Methylomonas sp.]PPD39555.1 MAG: hypothetical protein CTY21_01475 [Methylomonas sp.]PPD55806.1 MAG: hypothetical protein CTY11_00745 [Methylomonas sp.]